MVQMEKISSRDEVAITIMNASVRWMETTWGGCDASGAVRRRNIADHDFVKPVRKRTSSRMNAVRFDKLVISRSTSSCVWMLFTVVFSKSAFIKIW